MSPQAPRPVPARPELLRHGFTLVELMVVIVIISILTAFLLPAIVRTRVTARVAEAKIEITSLENAIVAFRTEFGIDPPSRITLFEDPADWNLTAAVRSRTLVRRLWPQFNFSMYRDINGDGDMLDGSGMHDPSATSADDVITMTGAECLMFFLGGITTTNIVNAAGDQIGGSTPDSQVTEWIPLGFSRNPRDPFERSGGTRIGPFHEFDTGRIADHWMAPAAPADPWMPEYRDTLPGQARPYVYVTSYDGKGYDVTDLGGSMMTNVYLQKDSDPATIGDPSEVPWNQSGFQIISPGYDLEYGLGGLYEKGTRFDVATFPARMEERDNITNFASGVLEE